jgi:Tol biopolymer transport system component
MKLQTIIFVLAFSLCLASQAKAQPSEQATTLVAGIQDLCWSPEGRYIYFSGMWHKPDYSDYHPGKWSIYRYDFKTKTAVLFADSVFTVAVDGTGDKIAVGKWVNGNRDIYVLDGNGKNSKRITTHPQEDFAPAWSPDGKQIAFNSKRDGKPEIYVVNDDATGLTKITFSHGFSSYNPAWSPDGKLIADYFEKGDRKDQIYVMKPDGSNAKNLTNDTLNNYFPGWIGKNRIMYSQDLPDKKGSRIFTVETDGEEKQPLLDLISFYARYSPDGSMIAYIDAAEGCIEVISAKGKLIEKIFLPE